MIQTYLSDILHVVAQGLLTPDIILLLLFIAYALYCIGSLLAEAVTERRHFKVVMPRFLSTLMKADEADIPKVIEESGLLNRHKEALLTVYEYRSMPGDSLMALVKRSVSEEESRYERIVGRNNTAARVAPMLGLMGTLIPLGPGIEALGRADTAALSSSLLVAFDTTVAGLVVAAVCLVVGKIRSNWYDNYLSALDAAMATMLEKIESMRETQPQASAPAQRQINSAADLWLDPALLPGGSSTPESADVAPVVVSENTEPESEPIASYELEPVAEPEPELEPEPVLETAPEPEPVAEPEPAPEPEPEPEPMPEPEPVPEPEPEPMPEPEPVPEPEPEPMPEPEPAPEPEPEAKTAQLRELESLLASKPVQEMTSQVETIPESIPLFASDEVASVPESTISYESVPEPEPMPEPGSAASYEPMLEPTPEPEPASGQASVQVALHPAIEPQAPISLIFEPIKDPLANDTGTEK